MLPTASLICCPRDRTALNEDDGSLQCDRGHVYPVVEGIPVLLVEEDDPTGYASNTLREIRSGKVFSTEATSGVDPMVQEQVAATSGYLYRANIGQLEDYPIPRFPFPELAPGRLLDVGSGWCRWTVAAAQAGFEAIAVDPWLDLLLAGVRASASLGVEIGAVVGNAVSLPFKDDVFDATYSYSVLQAFDKAQAKRSFADMARVVRPGGEVAVQLINGFGVRSMFNHTLQALHVRDQGTFRTRYWTPGEMRLAFTEAVGPTRIEVDSFFTQARQSDAPIMSPRGKAVLRAADRMNALSERHPWLANVSDNVFARATVRG